MRPPDFAAALRLRRLIIVFFCDHSGISIELSLRQARIMHIYIYIYMYLYILMPPAQTAALQASSPPQHLFPFLPRRFPSFLPQDLFPPFPPQDLFPSFPLRSLTLCARFFRRGGKVLGGRETKILGGQILGGEGGERISGRETGEKMFRL